MVFSSDRADSALWLLLLAKRAGGVRLGRDRPRYAQLLKPGPRQIREAMLAAVPGISVVGARALLDRFGSVRAVVEADEAALRSVPGVGPTRARALVRAFS